MNDKQLNNLFAFGIIVCILFTSGCVGIFQITLREKMLTAIEKREEAEEAMIDLTLRHVTLTRKYEQLEKTYKLGLFDGRYFQTMYVFKDDYLSESHATISIFHSKNDAETLQFAVDHATEIIGRGDFVIDRPINITSSPKILRDIRLWGGGINISERPPWYNESIPWYNPDGSPRETP